MTDRRDPNPLGHSRHRLVYLASHPITVRLKLIGQMRFMNLLGYDVHVVTADGEDLDCARSAHEITVHTVPIDREMRPWRDLRSLLQVLRLLRRLRPAIVNSGTPKAGALGMIAARLLRIPVRIYTLRGLRHETLKGLSGRLVVALERIACWCATRVICVSPSVRDACVQQKISSPDKLVVLGAGSSNGIDAELFDLGEKSSDVATALRHELAIPANAPVIGFIGRFTRDKGIAELFEAFQQVLVERSDCFLMLVGEFEEGDPVPEEIREQLRKHPQVRIVPFVGYAAPYYSVMSVLAFPSHREGMPVVPLEAAAAAVPTVAFIATGNVDAVVHGVTGILVSREEIDAFSQGILRYINDEHTRRNHGQAAKERVLREFRPETVWRLIADEYARELANNGTRKSDSASPRDSTPLPNAHSQQNQRIANDDSRCILHIDRS